MSFAGLLRQLRTRAGLTQEELAEAASVSARSVSDLERGINLTARKETARLLADALGLAGPARALFEAAARGQVPAADALLDAGDPGFARAGITLAPVAAVHALPRDTASFTGRVPELERLMRELETKAGTASIVGVHAIDGMAGIGKTTFAVHAAHLLAPRFPDGQFFLPLHSHTPGQQPADPGTALGTLLLAAGIAASQVPDGVDTRAMLWRNGVAGKKILLVLDDAASHEQVRPLLPGTPGSLVLITSRRRLAALEEVTPISLDTLPPADAAELFTRLTGRADSEAGAVADITRLCGYLPLALRLIAGTLRRRPAWTITDLAAELAAARDRLAAMRAENLSVAAAFDLSYQDLTTDQQRLFRRLGLHPGTSTDVHAAAALDDTTLAAARRHLDDLYDHHLITEPVRGRYRLHDLLREHARSLAAGDDAADREAAAVRLLDYYLYTAAAASRLIARRSPAGTPPSTRPRAHAPQLPAPDEAVAWLEAEHANLGACAEYAAAHALPVHAVWIPAQLSEFLAIRGYWDQAFTLHKIAAAAARAAGDRAGQAAALTHLGNVQHLAGDYKVAAASLSEALGLCRDLGDRLGQAAALTHLGLVQVLTDDLPAAATLLFEALGLYRDLGDRPGQADALVYLGFLQSSTGDYPAAAASLNEALAFYRDLGDRRGQARALTDSGGVQRDTGDYQSATGSLTQAIGLYRDLGDRHGEPRALCYLGVVQRLTGDYTAATASLTQSLEGCRDTNRHGYAHALMNLGAVQHLTGSDATAAASLAEALELCRDIGDRQGQAETLNHLGALLSDTRRHEKALACHTEALGLGRDIGTPMDEAGALEGIGRCHIQARDIAVGGTYLLQALEIYRRLGSPNAQRVQKTISDHGIRQGLKRRPAKG
jgi:tetratricopeptide (TPR) repeat protein/transcriptional regulator with XRE-family HTH domain